MLKNSFVRRWIAAAACVMPGISHGQTLKKDEKALVFPTFAYEGRDGLIHLSLHAWIFEPEPKSVWRQSLVRAIQAVFPSPASPEASQILERRLYGFTFDNERNKALSFKLGSRSFNPGVSGSDGHLEAEWDFTLSPAEKAQLESGDLPLMWDPAGLQTPLWIGKQGLSIISDIDDTIKITQVLNRKALITNSFMKTFEPVPGMPDIYQKLAEKGAAFHYVSASPWQLYPDLSDFIQKEFPKGTLSLRKLRWKDSSGLEFLWKDSVAYKTATITGFIQRFPQRTFLLIGDSGEKDPEVYEEIRRRFAKQIAGILIRIPPEQTRTLQKPGMVYFREAREASEALARWNLLSPSTERQ